MKPVAVATAAGECRLGDLSWPLPLDRMTPARGPWEVELGFGKGRYLLGRALAEPQRRFLGVEVAAKYFRLVQRRARRRGAGNLILLRGEARFLLAAVLPAGFATAVHVYFPDPWPKSRHEKRRLFDEESVDLVLRLLIPGGALYFATDHRQYGERVEELLRSHGGLDLTRRRDPWPEGPRTNYEAKYEAEGRPICRLEGRAVAGHDRPHPRGRELLLAACAEAGEDR